MRLFLSILYYFLFALILWVGALFLRSGETIIGALVRAQHEPNGGNIAGEFVDILRSEIGLVSEQVYVNTINSRLNSIEGLNLISKKRLREMTGYSEGMELSSSQLDLLDVKFKSSPWIKSYSIIRSFYPNRMKIIIEEAKPGYIADYLGVSWLVSRQGVLLEPSSEIQEPELAVELMKLPRIMNLEPSEADQDTYLSSFNDRLSYVIRSYENIDLAGGFPFQVSSLTLVPGGGIRVDTFDGNPAPSLLVDIHSLAEARSLLARLDAVSRDLKQRGEVYAELDFRFKDQVVVKK